MAYGGCFPHASPFVKDAFHRYVVNGETAAVNSAQTGTKSALHYVLSVPAGGEVSVDLQLFPPAQSKPLAFGPAFSGELNRARREADEFYSRIISRRPGSIFRRDGAGRRPVHGSDPRYADDPHFRDLVLFYEYFHGDNGRGVGASHQTGWTALAVRCLEDKARQE